ncbi:MAG: hypothetical protein L0287_17265 [Anaerolineae bacterium]|nr:hypothetical protein [Anaerolineae bacterium]
MDNVSITVSQSETQVVDVDIVVANARSEVKKILPNANLTFFSLVADCDALSDLQGEIHLFFSETRLTLFGERVFTARVVVDTFSQKLQMRVQDETEQYLSTELLELKGISVSEIANALEAYLVSVDKCSDAVVLARTDTNGPWGVRCGPPDKVFIECLEIDHLSGKITKLR